MEVKKQIWGVVPFLAMVSLEGCTIALTIMAKTAITYGMTTFVFVVYTNAVASIVLLPYSFIFHYNERTEFQQSLFSFPLFLRVFLLGLIGICVSQNLAFLGLSYSSPIVVCAMGLMLPAISFVLSIILGRTKINWKSPSFITKVVGTMISVLGATSEELYIGPAVRQHPSSSSHLQFKHKLLVFTSTTDRWIMGGLLLAAASLCVSIWNIIQLGVIKQYPQVMKVASFYSLVGTLLSAAVGFFVVNDSSAWTIKSSFDLFLIIATGIFSSLIRNRVQIWCMQMKGPYYVPMFKPFGILFATFFGVTFFGDTFHYGSVMAAFIAGMGYLTVMWGQIIEDNGVGEDKDDKNNDHLSSAKLPLLDEESKV
ncbi:WAT1-related protein At1g70260-like [Cucurbita pepo subsp. pepo]|uniref:WAT1-related protein At1g70260-like n=1 Tax=Cucurbita pepo subsp. pepo TaxID=3664 RepID=UPI000C9D40FF|nr:WAT1-related protein At1g70260-like [Cucurbita pepo subsp. pepo]